ncbi:unnamed protein product [Closterium sp. NIES-53]
MCYGGTTFNETDKTCYDPCVLLGKECGPDAICYPRGPDAVCSCYMNGFTFNEADKTCFPPLVRTVVELSGRNTKKLVFTFSTSVPAEQASGTTVCSNFSSSSGDSKITAVWDAPYLFEVGNGMCKSLIFFSGPGCTGQPGLSISRPAKKGRSYPATKRCVSVM